MAGAQGKRDWREYRAEGGGKGQCERLMKGSCFSAYSKGIRGDQDAFAAIENFAGSSRQGFFAVFDGHGSDRRLADFAACHVSKLLAEETNLNSAPASALSHAILSTDQDYQKQDPEDYRRSGCTACCCLIADGKIIVGNVGDSRAIVIDTSGPPKALSRDHKADVEKSRIIAAGGHVTVEASVARVQGQLAVSRSIGDGNLKQFVIAEPEMATHELTAESAYLLIASDGLWDVMKNKEAASLVRRSSNPKKACQTLMREALKRWSLDDITLVIVDLSHYKPRPQLNAQANVQAQAQPQVNVRPHSPMSAQMQGEGNVQSHTQGKGEPTVKTAGSAARDQAPDQGRVEHVTGGHSTAPASGSASGRSDHVNVLVNAQANRQGSGGQTPRPTPTQTPSPLRRGAEGQGPSPVSCSGEPIGMATVQGLGVSETAPRQSQLRAQASLIGGSVGPAKGVGGLFSSLRTSLFP